MKGESSLDHANVAPPAGWRRVSLSSVADVRFSNVDKLTHDGEVPVRLCNYTNVYNNDYIVNAMPFMRASATKSEIARFQLRKGDVIITKDSETPDDIGISAVVDEAAPDLVCGYHLALIRPNLAEVDPTFLAKQLGHDVIARFFACRATGSTRYGLANLTVESAPLLLPALKVQQAISSAIRQVDLALSHLEALIAKYMRIKTGLIRDLLTRGVDDDGCLRDVKTHKFKESPIGPIPEVWDVSSAGCQFEITAGFTLGDHRRPNQNRRRYLRVANVQRGFISFTDVAELEASDREVAKRTLREDDLLVVEGHADPGQIGRCARVPPEATGMTFQNHLFRLRPFSMLARFSEIWLNSPRVQAYWRIHCGTSSGLNTINRSMLERVPIVLPSKKEQQRIIVATDTVDAYVTGAFQRLRKLQSTKIGVMKDLLTGKVSVDSLLTREDQGVFNLVDRR